MTRDPGSAEDRASAAGEPRLPLRHPGKFGHGRIHGIPRLGTHRVNILAGPKRTRVVQAADANGHQVRCRAGQAKERRPARGTEGPPGRLPAGRRKREVLWAPLRDGEGRFGHAQHRGKRTARLALTIPTVTIEGEEWFGRTFIANRPTGAAASEGSSHKRPPGVVVRQR